ncbi:HD domain-containing phosphohydrolase [Aquabacterium sp.]|uniref:HD domain-containing phosphohydrolase n=1 Tax=Aquabacterium sp. TaxID=1872578 RepID=UPI00248A4F29|nr:HD domain-containing phosphohydrolase [Aquabacterium sp.]MDI1260013.1 response regulator [Aquabacterium sp.]
MDTPETFTRTVLCVDDEPSILSAMKRLFRSSGHRILIAESGAAALALLESEPIDLIISDMRMPMMTGAELLLQVRTRWPDITRLLLTGYADIDSTISAINEGQIHRYIAKPWKDSEILGTVAEAFERKALIAEKNRLEALSIRQNEELKTLNATLEQKVEERTAELAQLNDRLKKNYFNSIKSFSNLIELRGGQLVGHSRKVADLARRTAKVLNLDDAQSHEVFIAALMHDIGKIGLSDVTLSKPVSKMTPEESTRYRLHPIFGEQALMGLDDMQPVAALIRSHHERHDGRGFPDGLKEEAIPVGARILAIVDAYEGMQAGHLITECLSTNEARTMIGRGRGTQFDPLVLDAFLSLFAKPPPPPTHRPLKLRTDELRPGMILAVDFLSAEGVLLLAADHVLTDELIARIKTFERRGGQPILLAIKHAQERP